MNWVVVRLIMKRDGTATSRVLHTGTRGECQSVADAEPPDMHINVDKVWSQTFKVMEENEWQMLIEAVCQRFPGGVSEELLPPEMILISPDAS